MKLYTNDKSHGDEVTDHYYKKSWGGFYSNLFGDE